MAACLDQLARNSGPVSRTAAGLIVPFLALLLFVGGYLLFSRVRNVDATISSWLMEKFGFVSRELRAGDTRNSLRESATSARFLVRAVRGCRTRVIHPQPRGDSE